MARAIAQLHDARSWEVISCAILVFQSELGRPA